MPEEPEPDLYARIGVAADAPPDAIRRTYGERMRTAMEDRPRFEALVEAFDILKDPAKRAAYDRRRKMMPSPALTATATAAAAAAPPPLRQTGEATRMGDTTTMGGGSGAQTAVMNNATMGMGGDPLRTQALSVPPCPICATPGAPGEEFCLECGFLVGSTAGAKPSLQALPKLVELDNGREHMLKAGENTVGREGADIMLPDKTVSRRHARIVVDTGGGSVYVEDMGSTNGSRNDGHPLPAGQRAPLYDGAAIQFGSIKLKMVLPEGFAAALLALPAPEVSPEEDAPVAALAPPPGADNVVARLEGKDGQTHVLLSARTTFGRRPGNTIIIAGDSFVSGNHAEILYENEQFYLTDLGSTNGTQINGRKIPRHVPQPIKDSDEVMMGKTLFNFFAPKA